MKQGYKLTIVTTTRNNSQDLIATAKSIREQLNQNFEWLVYDGSDDEDERLKIERLKDIIAADRGGRVGMVHRFDNGIYEAMNNAVALCRGEFVIFLNCGDMFVDEKTVDTIEASLTEAVDVLHGDEIYIDCNGSVTFKAGLSAQDLWDGFGQNVDPYLDHMVCQQAIIYRRSVLQDNPLSVTFRLSADHDHFFDLFRKGYRFSYINRPLCVYVAGGFSFKHPTNCYFDWLQVQAKYADEATGDGPKHILKPFSKVFYATLDLALLQRERNERRQGFALVMEIIKNHDRAVDQAASLDRISKLFLEYSLEMLDLEFWTLATFFSEIINRAAPGDVVDVTNVHMAVLQFLDRIHAHDEAKLTAYELKLVRRLVSGAARILNNMPRHSIGIYKHLDPCNLGRGVSGVLSPDQYTNLRALVEANSV